MSERFDARRNLISVSQVLQYMIATDPSLLDEAKAAVARLTAREDSNVDTWARQLSEDLSKFKD